MSPQNTKVAEVAEALEAGWRPDPTGRYEWRYWDGGWTNRVASSRPAAPQPAVTTATDASEFASTGAPTGAPSDVPTGAPTRAPTDSLGTAGPTMPTPSAAAPSSPTTSATSTPAAMAAPVSIPWEPTHGQPEPAPQTPSTKPRSMLARAWGAIAGFFKSFADEPESYHSARAIEIEPDPRGDRMIVHSPANYGRAGLVALSACGVATGSYLPWLSGTIDGITFQQTGFEDGHGWAFTIGAFALVCAALLAVRLRPMRWIAIAIAIALAGLTFRDLVRVHDAVTTLNTSRTIDANVGTGLWIMAGCSVVALIASFRLGERE